MEAPRDPRIYGISVGFLVDFVSPKLLFVGSSR